MDDNWFWALVSFRRAINRGFCTLEDKLSIEGGVMLRFCAGTCSANLNQARVGEPRIFKHAMLHVSYFLP